jgi:hypothetical protein
MMSVTVMAATSRSRASPSAFLAFIVHSTVRYPCSASISMYSANGYHPLV